VSRKPARPICPADGALYADVAIGRAAVPELTQEQVSRATRARLLVLATLGCGVGSARRNTEPA
jgi:hypothetical protein